MGVNRQFQAKMAKYKNRNISKTINQIKTKFEDQAVMTVAFRGWSNTTQIKSNMAAGRHLEKQDAQLSKRDRTAGCVIVFAKSRTLERGDNDLRIL